MSAWPRVPFKSIIYKSKNALPWLVDARGGYVQLLRRRSERRWPRSCAPFPDRGRSSESHSRSHLTRRPSKRAGRKRLGTRSPACSPDRRRSQSEDERWRRNEDQDRSRSRDQWKQKSLQFITSSRPPIQHARRGVELWSKYLILYGKFKDNEANRQIVASLGE